jgi:hypothetical protein
MTLFDEATVQPAVGTPVDQHVGRPVPERASACGLTECAGKAECETCSAMRRNGAPKEADAYDMGAKGGPAHEGERLAFEAWMRGHCWALCATWTGTQYRSDAEQGGDVDPRAMRTRQLWAAWRDRAALARLKTPNVEVTG